MTDQGRSPTRSLRSWLVVSVAGLLLLAAAIGAQFWVARQTSIIAGDADQALPSLPKATFEQEKSREEAIARRIENQSKTYFSLTLASSLGAGIGALISLLGAGIAVFSFVNARGKDRQDRRDAQDKDRQDRLNAELRGALDRLIADAPRQRMVGAAGLLPFFVGDRADFHLSALSALVAALRVKEELPEVSQNLRLVIERAVENVAPDVLGRVSWRGVQLDGVSIGGTKSMAGLDLRDARLANARLAEVDLTTADLTNADLRGARLDGADLGGANLSYADFAGASLVGADLSGARLGGLKLLNADLTGTRFMPAGDGWRGVPWDAALDWRKASFEPAVRTVPEQRFGAEAPPLRVVMLMWEAPPFVGGGAWTACYHLVRRLRRRNARVTIVVPWERDLLADNPFGVDARIVGLGIVPPSAGARSGYAGSPVWSPYGQASAANGYAGHASAYGAYAASGAYSAYGPLDRGSALFRIVGDFRRRLRDAIEDLAPDVIHAHDWVTFPAARTAAALTGAPWIAHFHSSERERRPDRPDPLIARVELAAVDRSRSAADTTSPESREAAADAVIVPGDTSRAMLIDSYGADAARAEVIPNVLSDEPLLVEEMGQFETGRVIFSGRFDAQKGLDRFVAMARLLREKRADLRCEAFGDGDDLPAEARRWIPLRGRLDWNRRKQAFAGASVVVVPSRAEPFGMIIAEAMQQRVPVLYPAASGAADVLSSGVQLDPADIEAMAGHVLSLMSDLSGWEETVRAQVDDIDAYLKQPIEKQVMDVWKRVAAATPIASSAATHDAERAF